MNISEIIFSLVKYNPDTKAHIIVDIKKCTFCEHKGCITCCPAGCYSWEAEQLNFVFEPCLECGACHIICDKKAIDWNYPRGGFGVCYGLS